MATLGWNLVGLAAVGALLLAHRCGRFLVARACGIRVERFRLGVGPTLWRRTPASGTVFEIAAIPFGGWTTIRGLNRDRDAPADDPGAFRRRPAWQQLATILAGPLTDFVAVMVLAFVTFSCHGVGVPRWYGVASVVHGSPADGVLAAGDRITALDHAPLFIGSGPTLAERVNTGHGAPLAMTIERNGVAREVTITPREDRVGGRTIWRLGIQLDHQDQTVRLGILDAAGKAAATPFAIAGVMGRAWGDLLFGSGQVDTGGPIRMMEEFSRAFGLGALAALQLIMLFGVYVGLIHLLPIPGLEGAWLIALAYRLFMRVPPPPG